MDYQLLQNIHENLEPPSEAEESFLAKDSYLYYHYKCDGINDVGWGCGYRTLQSICSSLMQSQGRGRVPSIPEIQDILVQIGDKDEKFRNSRDWIGTLEASYVIDELFQVPCYIHHICSEKLSSKKDVLIKYFKEQSCLIMMGGDIDAASKGIAGIHVTDNGKFYLLVVDPHFVVRPKSPEEVISKEYVKWMAEDEFIEQSFYNLCMPKIR